MEKKITRLINKLEGKKIHYSRMAGWNRVACESYNEGLSEGVKELKKLILRLEKSKS